MSHGVRKHEFIFIHIKKCINRERIVAIPICRLQQVLELLQQPLHEPVTHTRISILHKY